MTSCAGTKDLRRLDLTLEQNRAWLIDINVKVDRGLYVVPQRIDGYPATWAYSSIRRSTRLHAKVGVYLAYSGHIVLVVHMVQGLIFYPDLMFLLKFDVMGGMFHAL